jgi:hypothetical protein
LDTIEAVIEAVIEATTGADTETITIGAATHILIRNTITFHNPKCHITHYHRHIHIHPTPTLNNIHLLSNKTHIHFLSPNHLHIQPTPLNKITTPNQGINFLHPALINGAKDVDGVKPI